MRKLNFFLLFMAVVSVSACFFLARSLSKKNPAVILSERSLTDTALALFSDDLQALTAAQIALQQQEINSRLLKLSEQDAQTRAKIEDIPFWLSVNRKAFVGSVILSGVCVLSLTYSVCLILVRRKTLVSMTFGTSQVLLPYRQIDSEHGAIRVLQTVLTEISQGKIDKEDLFRLFAMSRGGHITGQPMIDVTPDAPALTEGQLPPIQFQEAMKSFQPGQILTGFDNGKPIYFPIKGFVSAAVGGESGSGKTSKLRFLLAQLICNGVHVSILDAHEGIEESLVSSLGSLAHFPNVKIYHPFDAREATEEMIEEVQAIIDSKTPAKPARVYVLDELRPLNYACDRVEYFMGKVANEGRKLDLYGVFSSQTWEAKMFKESGSAARDACVFKAASRMPKEQARILFKDKEAAQKVAKLTTPEMYVSSVRYSGVVQVPFASPADMELLALEYLSKRETPPKQEKTFDIVSRPVETQIETAETIEETEQDGYSETLPAILKKVADYMRTNQIGLNEFCRRADIFSARGSLSEMMKGRRPLSSEMAKNLMDFFRKEG